MSDESIENSLLMSERRQRSHSKNFLMFTPLLVRGGSEFISDMDEIMEEYEETTGIEYEFLSYDHNMVEILRKHKKLGGCSCYHIIYIRTSLVPYIKRRQDMAYEEIIINYDRYKLDLIKKIVGSEAESGDIIQLIENLIFQEVPKLQYTESEYLEMISQTEK